MFERLVNDLLDLLIDEYTVSWVIDFLIDKGYTKDEYTVSWIIDFLIDKGYTKEEIISLGFNENNIKERGEI